MRQINTLILAGTLAAAGLNANAEITTCGANDHNRDIAEAYEQRWETALSARQADNIAGLYAESAVLMPPTDETLVGRQPIAEYLNAAPLPARAKSYTVELVSCAMIGDALHIAGVWGVPAGRGADNAERPWTSGNLMRVLKPGTNGNWVSAYEIWN